MSEHEVTTYDGCVHALKQPALRQSLYDAAAIMMSDVLVNLHGQEHRARRLVEGTIFRKDVFLKYEKTFLPRTLDETIRPFLEAGHGDLVDIGYRVMMNLTVDFAGIDRPERSAEETGELLRLLKEFSLAPALGQSLEDDLEPKKARIREAMGEFDTRFLTPSRRRREAMLAEVEAGRMEKEELPDDVLMALILGQEKLQMTDEQFLQEGIFYMLAGAHTTIHSLAHAMHELFEWLDANPQDIALLKDDPYFIQRCVFESLRLHPSSPVAKRRALCPVTLAQGDEVPEGDEVVVNMRAANRNPEFFGDAPDTYNPHREVTRGKMPYGLSMGYGMHACIGRNLAIGVEPKPNSTPEDHQYGTVPLIVEALLKFGVQRDPEGVPKKDETITRITWSEYPVVFKPDEALI
ncbi:cytochrome P450 [Paraurantiacibacter namhicola]|uniref:Pulcherriminic acid synthase n=1 Tax=Paraurantiacibacter namhicola TaxID=645517 RepID=A0A1C7DAD0_9SPHN|nr:cytochrome P450 [Paraurantiacibacter namhicola]ANU08414.1 Pulcherriminic acid synthase [Paraurantiacibacter namhicola]